MSEVKRYDMCGSSCVDHYENPEGQYVHFTDYEASQGEIASLREELAECKRQISEFPLIRITGCIFRGKNANGSSVIEYTDDFPRRVKSINMVDWVCKGPMREPPYDPSLKIHTYDGKVITVKPAESGGIHDPARPLA